MVRADEIGDAAEQTVRSECEGADRLPITRRSRSAIRVLITRLLVQRMTLDQHLLILAMMTLRRGHEADAAVAMLVNNIAHPVACGVQIPKAILGPRRASFRVPNNDSEYGLSLLTRGRPRDRAMLNPERKQPALKMAA